MTKEVIQSLIDAMAEYVPVSQIEEKLKMPKTTLQKVLKGDRKLPKKWIKPLESYFGAIPEKATIMLPQQKEIKNESLKEVMSAPNKSRGMTYQQKRLNSKLGIK
jgi:hypothetical protein